MIEVKLSFATLELAILAMSAVRAAEGKSDAPKPEAAAPATPKAAKDKTAATPPTAAPAPTVAPATPPAESKSPTTSSGVTREVMSAAIRAAAATHREIVLGVLTRYGATSAKGVPDDKMDAFMVDLTAALKPADDLGG